MISLTYISAHLRFYTGVVPVRLALDRTVVPAPHEPESPRTAFVPASSMRTALAEVREVVPSPADSHLILNSAHLWEPYLLNSLPPWRRL